MLLHSSWERGGRKCERKNTADTKVGEEEEKEVLQLPEQAREDEDAG